MHKALRLPSPLIRVAGALKVHLGLAAIVTLVAACAMANLQRPLDDGLAELRFALIPRPASQTLAIVEIDTGSLRAAGRWPWSRERFATAIRRLQDAGADLVAFDVDFSARSSPEADAALKAAIDRRPGSVILPTFLQAVRAGVGGGDGQLIQTSPLGDLSGDALVASVNVPIDNDGRVRRYRFGFSETDTYRPSVASLLAGRPYGETGAFLIDYGVKLDSLPRLSFEDVYTGRFDPALVRGRDVLIGATALELGDEFATRRAGATPGVLVHALAFESLKSGRALRPINPLLIFLAAVFAAWWLRPRKAPEPLATTLRRHVSVAVLAVAGPLLLQAGTTVFVDAGLVLIAQGLAIVRAARAELDRRAQEIVHQREKSLLHLATHQPDTELPNRRALLTEIGERLDEGRPLAVVTLGIDRFGEMRGAIGYGRFNQVVQGVAAQIARTAGETCVAQLSTSVLGLVLTADSRSLLRSRVRQLQALAPTVRADDHAVDAFLRTGVAYRDGGATNADALLENASSALDRARAQEGRHVIYDPKHRAAADANLALMSDMRRALVAGEIELHYQPKMAADTGTITGVEALVRWTHPTRGRISPDALIATAEETGMIRDFTDWAIVRAVSDLKHVAMAGHALTMSVNISGALLTDRAFKRRTLRTVKGLAHHLCLEITESAVIRQPDDAMQAIADYRAAGLKISIDDYGSGLSSLAYLKMLDADELKLDKSLLAELAQSARDRLILRSTIDLAHSLGMSVVAEGVEDQVVLGVLASMGCDTIQGWYVAKAMPVNDLIAFLDGRAAAVLAGRSAA